MRWRPGKSIGFCAGAPWGDVAAARGLGHVLVGSSDLWPGHPEKCLSVSTAWAKANPDGLVALTRALLQACAICNDPAESNAVADLLACIGLPRAACLRSLPGGAGRERVVFASAASGEGGRDGWHADKQLARWFLDQLESGGWATGEVSGDAADALYRPDLLAPALAAEARRLETDPG